MECQLLKTIVRKASFLKKANKKANKSHGSGAFEKDPEAVTAY